MRIFSGWNALVSFCLVAVFALAPAWGLAHGPDRIRELGDRNCRVMRFNTLEDLYGDTGNRFQGALGFVNFEAQPDDHEAEAGFGLAVDDVVIGWREFTLEEDVTNCAAGGQCATVFIQANRIYDGNSLIEVTVVDTTPSDNDCDFDGVQDATRDCNGNGKDDVPVEVRWLGNPDPTARLQAIIDTVGRNTYSGSFPISSSYDVPGTVFVAPRGNLNPVVQAEYFDWDDGSGSACVNSVSESLWGKQQAQTVVLLTPLEVVVTRSALSDNRDNDGWADDFETVSMRVEVSNKSGQDLTGISLRLSSNDPNIACITLPFLDFGNLTDAETRFSDEAFEFIMGDIGRTDEFAAIAAVVQVSIDADQFDATNLTQSLIFDLDLDATGGIGPSVYFEGFEGGFGSFTTMHIDEHLNPPDSDLGNYEQGVINSDGYRCTYSDPDWRNAASYGSSQGAVCFVGPNGAPDRFWWEITDDRAFSGARSMHMGFFVDAQIGYSTPVSQLEGIATIEPINLGWDKVCEIDRLQSCAVDGDCASGQLCVNASPQLSLKHQVNFLDHRIVGAQSGRSPDRGTVNIQIADNEGSPVGDWVRLQPFVNVYDSQANSNYFNCTFDPIDDGNDESSFFDPSDPLRSMGPSSTCAPQFSFTHQGDTERFDQGAIGEASDGPGLAGISGPGTWVEPRFDLDRFRGRRLRVRFIIAGLKLGGVAIWNNAFAFNPHPADDGWWVDDITMTDTLQEPATVSADLKDNSFLPGCGSTCGAVAAAVTVDPTASAAPGQVVSIDASASTVDRCIGGVLQYQFWLDADRSGDINEAVDVLLRDWTQNDTLVDTPQGDATYIVGVRCATAVDCMDVVGATVNVACPTSDGILGPPSGNESPFLVREPATRRSVVFVDADTLSWPSATTLDWVRGDLDLLRTQIGGVNPYTDTVDLCLVDNGTDQSTLVDATTPDPGNGFYYLGRSGSNCNLAAGGSYGVVGGTDPISLLRDSGINADGDACPN